MVRRETPSEMKRTIKALRKAIRKEESRKVICDDLKRQIEELALKRDLIRI